MFISGNVPCLKNIGYNVSRLTLPICYFRKRHIPHRRTANSRVGRVSYPKFADFIFQVLRLLYLTRISAALSQKICWTSERKAVASPLLSFEKRETAMYISATGSLILLYFFYIKQMLLPLIQHLLWKRVSYDKFLLLYIRTCFLLFTVRMKILPHMGFVI